MTICIAMSHPVNVFALVCSLYVYGPRAISHHLRMLMCYHVRHLTQIKGHISVGDIKPVLGFYKSLNIRLN